MLIHLLRIVFVVLAVLVGLGEGQFFYTPLFDGQMPPWFGAAMGFGVGVTLIAAEHAFRKRFTRSLVAFLIGIGVGLALSMLLLQVLRQVLQPETYQHLALGFVLITTYLVVITVLRGADRFRVVVPFVEFRPDRIEAGTLVLDPEAIADPRLAGLCRAGLFAQRLLVHRQVVQHCEAQAASEDPTLQARGRRGLEGLAELRQPGMPPLSIDETEIPNAGGLHDTLVRLARLLGARVVTADHDLARRATAEGVPVVDLGAMAVLFAPQVRPGDVIAVRIDRPGEGRGQGVGFLDDGSMVVASHAGDRIGHRVRCTVLRMHTTANGRMVFAEALPDPVTETVLQRPKS